MSDTAASLRAQFPLLAAAPDLHYLDSIPNPHAGQAFSKKQGAMPARGTNPSAIWPNLR